ncbi:27459_t:CDS:2 [Gigaspora margarita]|uniref:27459_t:CDS:1 n=1 Tax=Gigaspora margarita TaxID=4874 RepID=A0ABN7ULJ8_GIGMA|nr:27459_t:CDS:2 [Gigaspora margarita]
MDEIDDYENRIYDNGVCDVKMETFENDNFNDEVIAPNDSISVLSVSNTNLNANSNTNSSTIQATIQATIQIPIQTILSLLLKHHIDDFYEYVMKQKQTNQDIFCKFKQYIDEQVALKTTDIIKW